MTINSTMRERRSREVFREGKSAGIIVVEAGSVIRVEAGLERQRIVRITVRRM